MIKTIMARILKLNQSQSIIGVDVGTSSVKLAQMIKMGGEWTLVKSVCIEIESRREQKEEDSQRVTMSALEKAFAGIDTKGAKIVCVVNCPMTCIKKITAPHMPKQELLEAVRWEIKNHISFPVEEAILDFDILGEEVDKGIKKFIVAVAISPKATIEKQLSVYSEGRIKVSAMIPLSLALKNLIAKLKLKQGETIGVIDMGASITELNIYSVSDGNILNLEFSRKFPLAGEDITKSMTMALESEQGRAELSMEEAETIKRRYGLPRAGETQWDENKISFSQVLSLIRPMVEQLANELERSFDFYQEESHGGKVDKIILFGGGAKLKGLRKFLADEMEIEVILGNSLEDIKVFPQAVHEENKRDKNNEAHRLNLAIGAVLEEREGINLLPIEMKEETKRFIERISLKAIVTFVIMAAFLLYAGMRIQVVAYTKKLETAKLEQRSLAPQLQRLREKMLLDEALQNKPSWEDVLRELSNVVPPNMFLVKLTMKNDIINLKGITTQSDRAVEVTLSNFMLVLEQGMFKNVSLVTTRKMSGDAAASEFEIKCEVE